MDAKDIVKQAFDQLFKATTLNETLISQYFHPDYKQYVDGKELDYTAFITHMKAVKSSVHDTKVTFKHLISEGNSVCSVHIAEGTKANGKRVRFKVIAYFEIKENKIVLCDELSHLLEGDAVDRDITSRQ